MENKQDSAENKQEIKYNLYVKIEGNKVLDVIMPNAVGDISGISSPKEKLGWYLVSWPVNPHFTGRRGIIEKMENMLPFKEKIQ